MKKRPSLSVVMITRNAEELLADSLESVVMVASEIIIIDDGSTDATLEIASRYNARILPHTSHNLGEQKAYGIKHARGEWILILDSDEIVSDLLRAEIDQVLEHPSADVYYIPFKNHYMGRPLRYGGERYDMPRLFRRNRAVMKPALVHERIMFDLAESECMHSPIHHYSYRSLKQMYSKFTRYALWEARQKKALGESTSARKIFLNPPHMVWARFIEDDGWRDGLFRLPLDIGFGYMEFVTYAAMLFMR